MDKDSRRQVHFPRARKFAILALVVISLIFFVRNIAFSRPSVVGPLPETAALLILVLLGISIYDAISSRVITSDRGIEYSRPGMKLETSWHNVDAVILSPQGEEILSFKEPVMNRNGDSVKGISLREFTGWRRSGLGKAVQQHAPELMQD